MTMLWLISHREGYHSIFCHEKMLFADSRKCLELDDGNGEISQSTEHKKDQKLFSLSFFSDHQKGEQFFPFIELKSKITDFER